MHEVMGTTSYTTSFRRAKVGLGNSEPRYNSHVEGVRKKFYINSTRNSEETPEWMSRTQSHYHRTNMRNRSLNQQTGSSFMAVKQTYAYADLNKPRNIGGHFESVPKKKARSFWEMKNHTFQLQWPKKEEHREKPVTTRIYANSNNLPNTTRDFTFQFPKYAIKQSPLHMQKATPLKIGHTATVDSIYIK